MSDDEKKVAEVEALLDGVDLEDAEWTKWSPIIWGRYAKFNLALDCNCCKTKDYQYKKTKRKKRRELDQALVDNLRSYEAKITNLKLGEQVANFLEVKKLQEEQFKIDQVDAALDGDVHWKWLSDYDYWCEDDWIERDIPVKIYNNCLSSYKV